LGGQAEKLKGKTAGDVQPFLSDLIKPELRFNVSGVAVSLLGFDESGIRHGETLPDNLRKAGRSFLQKDVVRDDNLHQTTLLSQ
jgi:hypothetical protein